MTPEQLKAAAILIRRAPYQNLEEAEAGAFLVKQLTMLAAAGGAVPAEAEAKAPDVKRKDKKNAA